MTDTDGKITVFDGEHAFLSNFHQTDIPLTVGGHDIVFHSTEALFQASKVFRYRDGARMSPTDDEIRRFAEFASMTPSEAKKAGRRIALEDPAEWERAKVAVMRGCLDMKFRSPVLAQRLLETGTAELVEGNTWNDRYWGVCNGEGKNMLGRLLMERRSRLREKTREQGFGSRVRIVPVLYAKGHHRQNMVRLAFADPVTAADVIAQKGRPDVSTGIKTDIDPSVRQDLYQEYKYDVGYGAVGKDMTFGQWMEKYHPERSAGIRAGIWRNGPGGDPYMLAVSSKPIGNADLTRILSHFGQERFLSGRVGLEVDLTGAGAHRIVQEGTDNTEKLAKMIAQSGPGFDVDLLVGLVREKELEKAPEPSGRPDVLEMSFADRAREKKKADSCLSR